MDLGIIFSTFGLVFIAELGDKTQLAVMTQTCKFRSPRAVFLGASLALTAVTAIGVLAGQIVSHFIPADVLCNIAALAFIGMGVLIGREASAESEDCEDEEAESGTLAAGGWNWKAFGSTAALLFFAELGDKTQLAVMSMASKQPSPMCVLIGGAFALVAVTGIGVIGGREIAKRIPERLLLKVSAVAFVVMGALMLAGVF